MQDCLFCKIVGGELPAKQVYQDDSTYAFADIHPQAPTHYLILPRRHIASLAHATTEDIGLLGHLLEVAKEIAKKENLARGFRVVINSGPDGGQTVDHLHLHLLGGRAMHWPPG